MSSWSKRRKTLYASVIGIVLIGAVILPAFLIFYRAPTCTDGVQNGKEGGIDCGGSCRRLCQDTFMSASPAWTRFEEVAPGLYNVAAYIVNPNIEGEAYRVPYRLAFYDNEGIIITDSHGFVTIPPHRNTLAFQGAVNVGKSIPVKVLFEFSKAPNWEKRADSLSALSITDKKYTDEEDSSSLSVTLKNNSVKPIFDTTIFVILYDKDNNALGFSKTKLDEIPAQSSAVAPFTWPISRDGKVISIEVLPVYE
ncbi:MAG: hypothetical protein M3Q80_01490 [bacterium]|nr:hypothetical protein [bacterium]